MYEVGTTIDLTYLNAPTASTAAPTFRQMSSTLFDVGTRLTFRQVADRLVAARHIPVMSA